MKADAAVAIIPVRMSSQRLPGKPLAEIAGQTLVERVWRAAQKSTAISASYIATDDGEIAAVAREFGAEVVMTASDITTGSQRVAAAARELGLDSGLVVNLQGDMPFIKPELLDNTIALAATRPEFAMTTAATPIYEEEVFESRNVVKVVVTQQQHALYFSRAAIPASRDGDRMRRVDASGVERLVFGYKHFGLYVFRPEVLGEYDTAEASALEEIEKLEQLRLLERGLRIGVYIAEPELTAGSIEVDTPADLEAARRAATPS